MNIYISWLDCKIVNCWLQKIHVGLCLPSWIYFFLSPLWTRIAFIRMKASCKQRCNVVEQTPSRLRVAAQFVCSIYQSKADSEIYEWNKANYRSLVNNASQSKKNIHFYLFYFSFKKQSTEYKSSWWKLNMFSHQCIQKASQNIRVAFEVELSDEAKGKTEQLAIKHGVSESV